MQQNKKGTFIGPIYYIFNDPYKGRRLVLISVLN